MKIKTMSSKTRTSTMPKRSARGCKRSFPFWKFVFNVFIKILAKRRKLMVLVRTIGSCWKRSKLFSVKITCRLISKQCAEFLQIWCLTNFEKKIKMGVTYGTPMANDRLMKELRSSSSFFNLCRSNWRAVFYRLYQIVSNNAELIQNGNLYRLK